jgi:quinol monooxygenase YgiN
MYISVVYVHVKPEFTEAFIEATRENARSSRQEPGVVRFDFLQQQDDPTRFMLYEVYRQASDLDAHRLTAHYLRWRDTVTDWMAETRTSVKYTNLDPADADWT